MRTVGGESNRLLGKLAKHFSYDDTHSAPFWLNCVLRCETLIKWSQYVAGGNARERSDGGCYDWQ